MCFIEYANLYVEKYANNNLLLDFTDEREFIYFRNNRDYTDNMRLWGYTPSMLLFHNIKHIRLSEGDIISVPMEALINHKRQVNEYEYYRDGMIENERPYCLFMTFNNSDWLAELINNRIAFKNNGYRKKLVEQIKETWPEGEPCGLNCLFNDVSIEIVDVGQGSTNLIYNDNAFTIFDFGASISASQSMLRSIASGIQHKIRDFYRPSLIISHWDCDHFNLLTVIDEKFMKQICCVFVPSEVISLTAKQIARELEKNCRYIRTFSSPASKKSGAVGIIPAITRDNYVLYTGEKSKDINKSGLALVVKSEKDVTIFGADHTNKQIWELIYPDITTKKDHEHINIVVPHHGGKCGKLSIRHLSETPGLAVISVGKNTYKHPDQFTIDTYDNLGFDIKRTDWERANIIIQME